MSKPLKYEKPKLIDLSAAEWETGVGYCSTGSGPNQTDLANIYCQFGDRANSACFTGTNYGNI